MKLKFFFINKKVNYFFKYKALTIECLKSQNYLSLI